MVRARRAGILFVPELYSTRDGQTIAVASDRLWELSSWLPGSADYLQARSDERLRNAMHALAQLHRAWSSQACVAPSPTVVDRIERLRHWQQTGLLADHFASYASNRLEAALIRDTVFHLKSSAPRLQSCLQEASRQRVQIHPVLRDVWSDHILFSENTVTGIVDYGAVRVDEPATDVARLLGSLEPDDQQRWTSGLQYYREESGSTLDPDRVGLLDRVATLLSAAQWMDWLTIERLQFDVPASQLFARWEGFLARLASMRL